MALQPIPRRTHGDLGGDFFDVVAPAAFPAQILRFRNDRWAKRVGLASLDDAAWLGHFAAFEPLSGSFERPLALRYHGHQFRVYNPDIGDGRGFLFAQLEDLEDGRLLDLGTKGSGQTPYSRSGDGRLTLKGGVREVLSTALLEARGVYTSKSFSLVETGEALYRNDEPSPTRSCVLVRLSHSHIRFGSFQRQYVTDRVDNIEGLLRHTVRHYFGDLDPTAEPGALAVAFLARVAARTARTAAAWTAAGFVHGVLNTDNMNVTGESFDYGPYRFLPTMDPDFVAAYFDHSGLYAFGRQPEACGWNLEQLAVCLTPLAEVEALNAALSGYGAAFGNALVERLGARLGIVPPGDPADRQALVETVFGVLQVTQLPFERLFFDWYGGVASRERALASPSAEVYNGGAFAPLREILLAAEPVPGIGERLALPYFRGGEPVTLLYDEIEALWAAIANDDDWGPFDAALAAIDRARQAMEVVPP
ncbi:MAG: protein adenylyltransferase SelO family protein [Candidatus Competibacterales bacterium]